MLAANPEHFRADCTRVGGCSSKYSLCPLRVPPPPIPTQAVLAANPEQFRVDYALSREGPKNKRGGKMYSERRVGCQAGVGWGVGLALGVVWCGVVSFVWGRTPGSHPNSASASVSPVEGASPTGGWVGELEWWGGVGRGAERCGVVRWCGVVWCGAWWVIIVIIWTSGRPAQRKCCTRRERRSDVIDHLRHAQACGAEKEGIRCEFGTPLTTPACCFASCSPGKA